jgi:protein-tyrosine phosphatase
VTDLHSHLVPGVDDGARDLAEARAAIDAFVQAGYRTLVTTPHLSGSMTLVAAILEPALEQVDGAFASLRMDTAARHPALTLELGREIMLDTPELDLSDPRTRLAGGPYVLIELPLMAIPPRVPEALAALCRRGWQPVVAHPERYRGLARALDQVAEWRRVGARLQVNGPSLLGRYGRGAAELADTLLARGWCDVVASDHHAHGAVDGRAVADRIRARVGDEASWLLMTENPRRIAAGEDTLPVEAARPVRAGLWRRLLGRRIRLGGRWPL